MNSIEDIKHCLYINLTERIDRKIHVEKELHKIGISTFSRFNAIKLPQKPGSAAISCSLSHLACLQLAKQENWEHVLIVEDDIEFTNPEIFKTSMNQFLSSPYGKTFDVCLIAGNNYPPFDTISSFCVKVNRCQTTTGYLVNNHYYDTLIENISFGINMLLKDPEERVGLKYTKYQLMYSIDKWWFKLQQKDNWYLITPLTVTQKIGYSDIEGRNINYTPAMLSLKK